MQHVDHIKEYEERSKTTYRAFTSSSLISVWPALHRSPVVWVALTVNTVASLLSVYASTYLDEATATSNFALLVLVVTTLSGTALVVSGTLVSWICVIEENTVRRHLATVRSENPSLANIDLPIAISTISFYILAPAQLMSIFIYAGYVAYRSVSTIGYLLVVVMAFIYPLYLFARWRRTMIRVMRTYRNRLVDEYANSTQEKYEGIVTSYSCSSVEFFWRNVQAYYLLRAIVFLFLFVVLTFSVPEEHSFSVLIAMMMLVAAGQGLFDSVCMFQEDRVSLARVKAAM